LLLELVMPRKGPSKTANEKAVKAAMANADANANAPPAGGAAPPPSGGGTQTVEEREQTPEGFVHNEVLVQGKDEQQDDEVTEHARILKRLDDYQNEI
jgi:hypothetical protein